MRKKAFKVFDSVSITLHAFVWRRVFGRHFEFCTWGSELVEFLIGGTRTWESTAPINSQEGFGLVKVLKDMTLLTTTNARAGLDLLLKFCVRQILLSLNPRILFFFAHEEVLFSSAPLKSYHVHGPHYRKHSGRSTKIIERLRTSILRVFGMPFPTAFTRTRGFGTRWM